MTLCLLFDHRNISISVDWKCRTWKSRTRSASLLHSSLTLFTAFTVIVVFFLLFCSSILILFLWVSVLAILVTFLAFVMHYIASYRWRSARLSPCSRQKVNQARWFNLFRAKITPRDPNNSHCVGRGFWHCTCKSSGHRPISQFHIHCMSYCAMFTQRSNSVVHSVRCCNAWRV